MGDSRPHEPSQPDPGGHEPSQPETRGIPPALPPDVKTEPERGAEPIDDP